MRLWKISYISIATAPEAMVNGGAQIICTFAEQHNARHNITGILTLHSGRFAQVLEGPESMLRALMARITADTRHLGVKVIADCPLGKRRYANWSMAFRDPKEFVLDQLNGVLDQTSAIAKIMPGTRH